MQGEKEQGKKLSKKRKNWVILSLLVVVLLSAFLRIHPLFEYFIWGSDSGEYYFITEHLVEESTVPQDYKGWGFAYPYFTGMENLAAAFHFTSGLSLFFSLFVFIPLASSLLVLPIFLIAQEISHDHRISLLSSAIVAVISPSVFTTSHPMPGALGDFLNLVAILIFLAILKYHKNENKLLLLFLFVSMSVALTHHLSFYFLFVTLFFVTCFEILLNFNKKHFRIELVLIFFLVLLPPLYWALAFPKFRENVMDKTVKIGVITTDESFLPFFVVLPLALFLISIFFYFLYLKRNKFRERLVISDLKITYLKLLSGIGLLFFFLFYVAYFGVPGTDMKVPSSLPLFFAPFAFLLGFAFVGRTPLRFSEKNFFLYGWFAGLTFSFLVNTALDSKVLLGYRHLQYLVEPAALFAAFGIVFFHDFLLSLKIEHKKKKRCFSTAYVVFVSLVVSSLMFSAYPPPSITGGFEEGTTVQEFESVLWIAENIQQEEKIVTDHRMSSMVFGFAKHPASWDSYREVYMAENYEKIEGIMSENNLRFVLLTQSIKRGVALEQWENAEPMSKMAREKFKSEPFIKIYANEDGELYMR